MAAQAGFLLGPSALASSRSRASSTSSPRLIPRTAAAALAWRTKLSSRFRQFITPSVYNNRAWRIQVRCHLLLFVGSSGDCLALSGSSVLKPCDIGAPQTRLSINPYLQYRSIYSGCPTYRPPGFALDNKYGDSIERRTFLFRGRRDPWLKKFGAEIPVYPWSNECERFSCQRGRMAFVPEYGIHKKRNNLPQNNKLGPG